MALQMARKWQGFKQEETTRVMGYGGEKRLPQSKHGDEQARLAQEHFQLRIDCPNLHGLQK